MEPSLWDNEMAACTRALENVHLSVALSLDDPVPIEDRKRKWGHICVQCWNATYHYLYIQRQQIPKISSHSKRA